MKVSKNTQCLVVYGSLDEGFTFIGPFDNYNAAIHYAERDAEDGWVICTLYPPDSSAQSEDAMSSDT